MKVIICEKADMARYIVEAIKTTGDNVFFNKELGCYQSKAYYITSLAGHIFELYNLDEYFDNNNEKVIWKLERLPFKPENNLFKYKLKKDINKSTEGKEYRKYSDIYKTVYNLIHHPSVDAIINSGDPDAEGCLLVKEVIDASKTNKPVLRLWCNDLVPDTILKELEYIKPNEFYKKYESIGLARTYSDWIWGINGSRFLSIKTQQLLPVGRVNNCILGEIYKREMERKNFVPTSYYSMESNCETQGISIKLISKINTLNSGLSQDELQVLANDYNKIGAKVIAIENDDKIINPKKLFSLTTLQKYMSKNYKMSSDKVKELCQANYEKHKIMSYPRTEEEFLSINEQDKAKKIIASLNKEFGSEKLVFKFSNKIFQEVESHSALHPTGIIPDYNKMTSDEKLIYNVVKNRFCSVFSKEELVVSETKMNFIISGENDDGEIINEEFVKKAEVIKQPGWTAFEPRKPADNILPDLQIGDKVNVNFALSSKETTPKSKFNEASILTFCQHPFKNQTSINAEETINDVIDDEEYEYTDEDIANVRKSLVIGTPATRDEIIKNLKNKELIKTNNSGEFDITEKGIYLIETLQKLNIDFSAERTALLSYDMARIDSGEKTIDEIVNSVFDDISKVINKYRDVDFEKLVIPPTIVGECPICNNKVIEQKNCFACENNDFVMLKNPKKLFQKCISTNLASKFLKNREVKITDLKNKDGKLFTANAVMNTTLYKDKYWADFSINFNKEILCNCPCCDGKIEINKNSYSCENNDFVMVKKVFFLNNKAIPKEQAKKLIENGRARFLNLISKTGNEYSAEIIMIPEYNEADGINYPKYEFEFDEPEEIIGYCPICNGKVVENPDYYKCLNNDFIMFKDDKLFIALGKKGISRTQAKTLLKTKEIRLTDCTTENKENFNTTLVMGLAKSETGEIYFPKFTFKRRTSGGNRFKPSKPITNPLAHKKVSKIGKPKQFSGGHNHEISK